MLEQRQTLHKVKAQMRCVTMRPLLDLDVVKWKIGPCTQITPYTLRLLSDMDSIA